MSSKKLQSRKFFAFMIWVIFMGFLLIKERGAIIPALPYFGGVTGVYIGTQAIIDLKPVIVDIIKAWKGKEDE